MTVSGEFMTATRVAGNAMERDILPGFVP